MSDNAPSHCIDLTQSEVVSSTTPADEADDEIIFIDNPALPLLNQPASTVTKRAIPDLSPPGPSEQNDVIIVSDQCSKPKRPTHSSLSGLSALAGLIDTQTKFKPLKEKRLKRLVAFAEQRNVIEIPDPVDNRPIASRGSSSREEINIGVNDVQRVIKRAERRISDERKREGESLYPDKATTEQLAARIVGRIDEGLSVVAPPITASLPVPQVQDEEVVVVNDAQWEVVEEAGEEVKVLEEINSSDKDRCAICLAASFSNRSFLNSCFHAFCYFCIMQWSEISQTCPLCKSPFRYIVHDVKSITDYKETHVSKEPAILPPERRAAFRPTVRYRTTVGADRERAGPGPGPTLSDSRQRKRRAHDDVIKESRERVYTNQVFAKAPADCRKGKQRICTPDFFKQYPGTKHRIAQWLNNELEVLLYENKDHVTFVMQIVWCALDKYPILSEEFKREVRAFLFDNTKLFCHELQMYAQSPFDFKTYLQKVQYDFPTIDLEEAPSQPSSSQPSSSQPSSSQPSSSQPSSSQPSSSQPSSSQPSSSHWDSSPVRYVGGVGSNSTIAKSRWDDSPVTVTMATMSSEQVVTMVTEVTTEELEVTDEVTSDGDSIEFLYEKDTTRAPTTPVYVTSPSTPVYVTSPPTTPIYPNSPGDGPCPTTPVYVTVYSEESKQSSKQKSGKPPVKASPKPSKGKGKQRRKKIIVSDEPTHNKRLRSAVVRIPASDDPEQPCSSRDIT